MIVLIDAYMSLGLDYKPRVMLLSDGKGVE